MDLQKVKDYIKDKTIKECAERFNVSYYYMAHYVKKHNLEHKSASFKGENNGNYKHGQKHTRLYHIWLDIKQRCLNPKNKAYVNYGGRGINICEEWKRDFYSFYEWAKENNYSDALTIDRIDVNKGYCTENCRWVSMKVQANNTRRCRKIEYKGKVQTLMEWAEELNMNYDKLRWRVNNWKSIKDCFEK